MRKLIYLCALIFCNQVVGLAQVLPAERSVDWTRAGLQGKANTEQFKEIEVELQADRTTSYTDVLNDLLSDIPSEGAVIRFPKGTFHFNQTIHLPSNVVLKGAGATATIFTFDLGGKGHSISIAGSKVAGDTTSFMTTVKKDAKIITVKDASRFQAGDWLQIIQDDSELVTSTWAKNTVGQIVEIERVQGDDIILSSPLRMDYKITRRPWIQKIEPIQNTGVACLTIKRLDDTAPQQSSNIHYKYAVNAWVKGIESENCTFSHIQANQSSNLYIANSYFHHAFGYGVNGRAYGVMLQMTTNECLVENNIFEHLRHAMIVQAGANGNVFAYNYSLDPYSSTASPTSDATGDIVLHGNYPYANLFENNICQNMVIDNSHGPNGAYNTMFRNRGEKYGIFFSEKNSPKQNLIGNEITNTAPPYSFVNYRILGEDHFVYGNNDKVTIRPTDINDLEDVSYAYDSKPAFLAVAHWGGVGLPSTIGTGTIPAKQRHEAQAIFENACDDFRVSIAEYETAVEQVLVHPNPICTEMQIESAENIQRLCIVDGMGRMIYQSQDIGTTKLINTASWSAGIYFITIETKDKETQTTRVVKY